MSERHEKGSGWNKPSLTNTRTILEHAKIHEISAPTRNHSQHRLIVQCMKVQCADTVCVVMIKTEKTNERCDNALLDNMITWKTGVSEGTGK